MDTTAIFSGLTRDNDFFKTVIPYLKKDYFQDPCEQLIFDKIKNFVEFYNKPPLYSDLRLLIQNDMKITESETNEALDFLKSCNESEPNTTETLINETEKWIQNRSIEMAILTCVDIMREKPDQRGAMPDIMKEALSVGFTTSLGHDYFRDAPSRFDYYTSEEEVIKTDVEAINQALGGGFRRKAIFVFSGMTNVGKSLWLSHIATSLLRSGLNVLYISCEMSEHMVGKRLDANLLNYEMGNLDVDLPKKEYLQRVKNLYKKVEGRLKVKEYPTGVATANHVRAYLKELQLKDDFKPDVIIGDYLNIFASHRLPPSAATNSYLYVKSIIEELRAVAQEENVPFVTGTQINRSGGDKGKDVSMTDLSESFGTGFTADWMGAIIQNEELFALQKYLLKVTKTRFDGNNFQIYTLGVDRNHMRLHDLGEDEQELPMHVKDQLEAQVKKSKEKDKQELENVLEGFDFEAED